MSEDYARQLSQIQSHKKAYDQVKSMLAREGYHSFCDEHMDSIEFQEGVTDNIQTEHFLQIGMQQYNMLNTAQKHVTDTII